MGCPHARVFASRPNDNLFSSMRGTEGDGAQIEGREGGREGSDWKYSGRRGSVTGKRSKSPTGDHKNSGPFENSSQGSGEGEVDVGVCKEMFTDATAAPLGV